SWRTTTGARTRCSWTPTSKTRAVTCAGIATRRTARVGPPARSPARATPRPSRGRRRRSRSRAASRAGSPPRPGGRQAVDRGAGLIVPALPCLGRTHESADGDRHPGVDQAAGYQGGDAGGGRPDAPAVGGRVQALHRLGLLVGAG